MSSPRSMARQAHIADVAAQAQHWLELMKGRRRAADDAAFLTWLNQSPLHVRELLCAQTWDRVLDQALDPYRELDIDDLILQAQASSAPADARSGAATVAAAESVATPDGAPAGRNRWRFAGLAAAASLLIGLALYWRPLPEPLPGKQQFATAIGEQRSIALADGSVVHLNTRSSVRIAFSDAARDVYLLDGQAIFQVKRDAGRPFRVHVDSTIVQAIGTRFDVRRLEQRTSVAVIEGVVKVNPDAAQSVTLPAGETAVIASDGKLVSRASVDPQEAGAWQQRRLIFRKVPLEDIAVEFNRYNRVPRMRVEGEAVRAKRYSGSFNANDLEAFLLFLAVNQHMVVERTDTELIVRAQSDTAQSPPAIQQ